MLIYSIKNIYDSICVSSVAAITERYMDEMIVEGHRLGEPVPRVNGKWME